MKSGFRHSTMWLNLKLLSFMFYFKTYLSEFPEIRKKNRFTFSLWQLAFENNYHCPKFHFQFSFLT